MTSSPRGKSFFGSFDISYPVFWFVLLSLFQVNLAWAQTGSRSAAPSTQLKDPAPVDFVSNELLPVNWSGSKARGVFYRPSKDNNHPVLRVYVAGRYQAGLLPDSFSELCLPVGEQSVQFLAGQTAKLRTEPIKVSLVAGESRFFQITSPGGAEVMMQEVSKEQALQEASQAIRVFSINRLPQSQDCRDPK